MTTPIKVPRTNNHLEIEQWRLSIQRLNNNAMTKIVSPVAGNLVEQLASGGIKDAGIAKSDLVLTVTGTTDEITATRTAYSVNVALDSKITATISDLVALNNKARQYFMAGW